jgi:ABC-type nitrate/sulfonate/bicarbonate transport system permease component
MQIRSFALTGWLDRLARSWVSLAFAVGFFALWEALVRGFDVPRYIVPAPSSIAYQFWRNLPRILEYSLITGGETLMGFAVAILLGVCAWTWSSRSSSCWQRSASLWSARSCGSSGC